MVNYVTDNRVEEGVSLWDLLGVPERVGTDVIDKAWQRCDQTLAQRYAWKALRDPLYRKLYQIDPRIAALEKAGFFDDGLPCGVEELTASDPRFLCTPLKKIKMGVSTSREQYILVTTGAFSPVHNGHIAMMERAIAAIRREGNLVVGAYFCPGHDSYVGKKNNGTAAIPAVERVHMLEIATESHDLLAVDPWAARYLPCEVNFTDVLRRMRRYMDQHFRNDVKIAYVYGTDNIGFGHVLKGSEFRSLPVSRTQESSTAVREGASDMLPAAVREYRESKWPQGVYQIRDDMVGDDHLRSQVIETLSTAMAPNPIEVLDVNSQRIRAHDILDGRQSISMDPFFHGTYQINMCRAFYPADTQTNGVIVQRPGEENISEQVALIPPGDYVLVEDDVATGRSIAHVKSYLRRSNINITEDLILANLDTRPDNIMDVVDARDFMIDAPHGGLVVQRLGYTSRAPYLLPFVSLRSRAMVQPDRELTVSLRLWRQNRDYLAAKRPGKTFKECGDDFFTFATKHGWYADTTLVDYCDFHIRVLEEAQGKPCTPA